MGYRKIIAYQYNFTHQAYHLKPISMQKYIFVADAMLLNTFPLACCVLMF